MPQAHSIVQILLARKVGRQKFPIGQIFSIKPRRRNQHLKFKGVNRYVGKNITEEASFELSPSQRFCNSRIKDSRLILSPRHFESLYTPSSIRSTEGWNNFLRWSDDKDDTYRCNDPWNEDRTTKSQHKRPRIFISLVFLESCHLA